MPKGDELCPLGFAPHSVRPTRCKRCFRDYSEHKKKEPEKSVKPTSESIPKTNETKPKSDKETISSGRGDGGRVGTKIPDDKSESTTTGTAASNATVRRRRPQSDDSLSPPTADGTDDSSSPNGTRRRARQRPLSWGHYGNGGSSEGNVTTPEPAPAPSPSPPPPVMSPSLPRRTAARKSVLVEESSEPTSADVQFMLAVKTSHLNSQRSPFDDNEDVVSVAGTETTDTTLVYQDTMEELQTQVTTLTKQLAEQNPNEKVNETIKKLKQKVFELETANEELKDEQNVLQLENKELQQEMDKRPPAGTVQKKMLELQQKLQASESMCEELMEENEEYKREIQGLEDEMNEIQDNFSEDQASQYMDIKKELEQTAKNCRVLQFKLKKTERRCAQMESEKTAAEEQLKAVTNADNIDLDKIKKIQQLEAEIKASKEVTMKLTTEMDALNVKLRRAEGEAKQKTGTKGNSATLPVTEQKPGRPHSPVDDPSQLMRELYDTVEREKDMREQLKYSEEEARSLRKRMTNLEEENEGLLLQIKKMATTTPKSKDRRTAASKDKEDDSKTVDGSEQQLSMTEMKLQMELLEQEAKVLRKKLGDMETNNESLNKEIKKLQCQVSDKQQSQNTRLPPMIVTKKVESDIDLNYYEQRIKLLDGECNELRRKLIDKERENEQLTNDLEVSNRRRGSKMITPAVQRSRSLDGDSQQIDLKRQLQLIEQEVVILRQKANDSEAENERLTDENKQLQLKVGTMDNGQSTGLKKVGPLSAKLKEKISELETEAKASKKRMSELEEENQTLKKSKTVKKGAETSQVEKLEQNLKIASNSSEQLKKQLEQLKLEQETRLTGVETEKKNLQKELGAVSTKLSQETEKLNKAEDDISALRKKLLTATKSSDQADKKREEQNQTTLQTLNRKLEKMEKDFEDEKEKHGQIKKRLDSGELIEFEQMRKVEQEKHKLQKESLENEKKMSELNRRIQDMELSVKDGTKIQRNLRRDLEDSQKEMENERVKLKKLESKQNEAAILWAREKEELRKNLNEANGKWESVKGELIDEKTSIKAKIEHLDAEAIKTKTEWMDKLQRKDNDIKAIKDQLSALRSQLAETQAELLIAAKEGGGAEYEEKYRRLEMIYNREKDLWTDKEVNLESVMKTEVKRRERMEKDHEAELRDRDEDMIRLKDKIKKQENELKKLQDQKGNIAGEMEDRIKGLMKKLEREGQEYDDLTSKYEMLEEEYLVLKAQKVMEKEQVAGDYSTLKRSYDEIEGELKALRETFNVRQDTWIKEKLDQQEKVKELTSKLSRANVSVWDLERARLKETIEEKQNLLDQTKKEDRVLKEEVERLKRQVDDTKRMLEDYNKLKSYGKNFNTPLNSNMEKEIEELNNKIQANEKAHRSELSSLKMKSEQRLVVLQDEIHALHLQNAKFRREKDTFKEMLEGAQKTLGDLKSDSVIKEKSSHVYAQLDEAKQKLEMLWKEKEEVLDKLDLAERNCSKTKTEYMTEKASWEIRTATMQTKINELEETTILQGGRSKIFGVKTKLELAWQKEREEQHRLLTESHKMARDLKQRLLDIESARDRERLESVRHLDQLRETMDEQQNQLQMKINELTNELKDLRQVHAKMASTHERMRRQKDRLEWEKEGMLMVSMETKQLQLQDKIAVSNLGEELRNLKSMVPKALGEGWDSSKGSHQVDDQFKETFKSSFKKISAAVDDLKKLQGQKSEDQIKRNLSFRRAISEDEDESGQVRVSGAEPSNPSTPLGRWRNPQRVTNYPLSPPSMYISPPKRPQGLSYNKTQSLDMDTSDGVSRGSNASLSSQGLEGGPVPSPRVRRRQRGQVSQQSSFESDISNTSLESLEIGGGVSSSSDVSKVQSVVSEGGRKRGFKEKLKRKLMKTKSIEGTPTADHIRHAGFQVMKPGLGGGSASSVASEVSEQDGGAGNKGSKDLKSRITKLFQRSGSRSASQERMDSSANAENGKKTEQKSQTLNRPLMVSPKSSVSRTGPLSRYGSTGALNK